MCGQGEGKPKNVLIAYFLLIQTPDCSHFIDMYLQYRTNVLQLTVFKEKQICGIQSLDYLPIYLSELQNSHFVTA